MEKKTVKDYVKKLFGEYYKYNIVEVLPPTSLDRREFGFLLFEKGIMLRHKKFLSKEKLHNFLQKKVPSNVYYSSAYYEKPDENMNKKGWLGSDLIFDIDADHIQTPCHEDHRFWICKNCLNVSRVQTEICPQCEGTKFNVELWTCEKCLEAAKLETLKLIEFLISDLGFSTEEIDVCFSGQRGYHVHIESENIRRLNQSARKEIVDYVSGTGLKPVFHGFPDAETRKKNKTIPEMNAPGWGGRLAREIKGKKIHNWQKDLDNAVQKQKASVDTVVTIDLHRLIRLPTTLHGKTGFIAAKIQTTRLEEFNPFTDALAFKEGALTIHINESEKFKIGETEYGPFKHETIELPLAAAVFLLCKNVAQPVE